MLVLETLEQARARGAKIYAELAGFGMSADAHHLTNPLPEGAARAMRDALYDAGLSREQINYVNAHGTGTPVNDSTETRALRQVFASHANNVAVSSTKSMHGHTLGAAGALEAAATVLALRGDFIPPTANFLERDPACDLAAFMTYGEGFAVSGFAAYPELATLLPRARFYRSTFAILEAPYGVEHNDEAAFARGIAPCLA